MEVDFATDGTQLSYLCLKTRKKIIRAGDPPAEVQSWKVEGRSSRKKVEKRRNKEEEREEEGGVMLPEEMEEEKEKEGRIDEEEKMEEEEVGINDKGLEMEEEASKLEEQEGERKKKEINGKGVRIIGIWGYGRLKITGIGFFYQEEEKGGKQAKQVRRKEWVESCAEVQMVIMSSAQLSRATTISRTPTITTADLRGSALQHIASAGSK